LIAQEVEKILPEVILKDDQGMLTLSYDKMLGLVVQAMNEMADQIDGIKKIIDAQ
jgi:hypothetical protein